MELDVGLRRGLLAEPVDPDRPQPELARRRDVVEEARGDVDVPRRSAPVRSKNASQWRCPGLYEPISDATIASSNGTPIRSIDASM